MENGSNVEGKKSRALASKSSLYRVCVFHNAKRRLTRGLINSRATPNRYIVQTRGGSPLTPQASLTRADHNGPRASASLCRKSTFFLCNEFGSQHNTWNPIITFDIKMNALIQLFEWLWGLEFHLKLKNVINTLVSLKICLQVCSPMLYNSLYHNLKIASDVSR